MPTSAVSHSSSTITRWRTHQVARAFIAGDSSWSKVGVLGGGP